MPREQGYLTDQQFTMLIFGVDAIEKLTRSVGGKHWSTIRKNSVEPLGASISCVTEHLDRDVAELHMVSNFIDIGCATPRCRGIHSAICDSTNPCQSRKRNPATCWTFKQNFFQAITVFNQRCQFCWLGRLCGEVVFGKARRPSVTNRSLGCRQLLLLFFEVCDNFQQCSRKAINHLVRVVRI